MIPKDDLLEWIDQNISVIYKNKFVDYNKLKNKINELSECTTGQQLIESAAEALAFARGEPNDCVVYHAVEPVDTDGKCPVIPVHDMGGVNV